MEYTFKYEDSLQRCEALLTNNFAKLSDYSDCPEREREYVILKKKLDIIQENIKALKSEYDDLTQFTQNSLCSSSFEDHFTEKFFDYLVSQEVLRRKFIGIINDCRYINLRLDDFLYDCSSEALNDDNSNLSSTVDDFDSYSMPEVYVLVPRLDWDYDLSSDVTVKICDSTIVLKTKKIEDLAASNSKQNGTSNSNLGQSLVCNICHRNFSRKQHLKDHMFLHDGLKPFECAECGKSFATKDHVRRHILTRHFPYHSRPYKCDICSKLFSYQGHLNNHRRKYHSSSESSKKVEGFMSAKQRKVTDSSRSRVCQKQKPFECAECGRSFARKDYVSSHIFRRHIPYQSRPYKCDICSKLFCYRNHLNYHRKIYHSTSESSKKGFMSTK
ncbi:zinc finger protein 160-like [Planococcus citri]|uniref:zinc finger protein 160-like n=1 Tax=Planococcus citri TaxID=170843 RepID=UPI0031F89FE0